MKKKLLISLIAGAALPFSFAPVDFYALAFFCPAVLCYVWMRSSPRQALFTGFAFGLGFFLVGTSWIFISINTYGNTPLPISLIITGLFIFILSMYPATQGWLIRLLFRNASDAVHCLCLFPASWVVWEWLRSTLFTGFPWVLLGYSQIDTPLRGFAPIVGIYGISLITALISGCLVVLVRYDQSMRLRISCTLSVFAFMLLGWGFSFIHWTKPVDKPIQVSLVQGNIAQSMKWNPDRFIHILKKYQALTNQHWNSKLIIWPEAAIPAFQTQAAPFIEIMNHQAKQHNVYLITGIPIVDPATKKYYNGLIMMGAGQGRYLKRHLVPFGEYMPLRWAFQWFLNYFKVPMSSFSPGPAKQPPLKVNNFAIAPFICYEIVYPQLVLNSVENAQMLLVIVDDSWFGKSLALYQHLQMTAMRSLETQRYTLMDTNTGITAIINPQGKIVKRAPIDKTYVLTQTVRAMAGKTPLMWWHYYPIVFIVLLLIIIATARTRLTRKS